MVLISSRSRFGHCASVTADAIASVLSISVLRYRISTPATSRSVMASNTTLQDRPVLPDQSCVRGRRREVGGDLHFSVGGPRAGMVKARQVPGPVLVREPRPRLVPPERLAVHGSRCHQVGCAFPAAPAPACAPPPNRSTSRGACRAASRPAAPPPPRRMRGRPRREPPAPPVSRYSGSAPAGASACSRRRRSCLRPASGPRTGLPARRFPQRESVWHPLNPYSVERQRHDVARQHAEPLQRVAGLDAQLERHRCPVAPQPDRDQPRGVHGAVRRTGAMPVCCGR